MVPNPIKMDDLGVLLFLETPISVQEQVYNLFQHFPRMQVDMFLAFFVLNEKSSALLALGGQDLDNLRYSLDSDPHPCTPMFWYEMNMQVNECFLAIHMFLRPKENDPKLWSPEKDMLQAGIEFVYRFIGDFEASDLPGAFNMAKPKNQGIIRDHGLHAPALVSCGNLESNPEMPGLYR